MSRAREHSQFGKPRRRLLQLRARRRGVRVPFRAYDEDRPRAELLHHRDDLESTVRLSRRQHNHGLYLRIVLRVDQRQVCTDTRPNDGDVFGVRPRRQKRFFRRFDVPDGQCPIFLVERAKVDRVSASVPTVPMTTNIIGKRHISRLVRKCCKMGPTVTIGAQHMHQY